MRLLRTATAGLWMCWTTTALAAPGVKEKPAPDESVQIELKKLEGSWRTVKSVVGGKEDPDAVGDLLGFKGNKVTLTWAKMLDKNGKNIVQESTITVDPSKSPKWTDITLVAGKDALQAIYELTGDTYKVVIQPDTTKPRPTEFRSNVGSQEVFVIYERVKPKK